MRCSVQGYYTIDSMNYVMLVVMCQFIYSRLARWREAQTIYFIVL